MTHVGQTHQLPPAVFSGMLDGIRRFDRLTYEHKDRIGLKVSTMLSQLVVSQSQFEIAQHILKHPSARVFSEGLIFDTDHNTLFKKSVQLDPELLDLIENKKMIKKAFAHGIPTRFSDLTEEQKFFLGRFGADYILLFLGVIKKLHATTDPDQTSTVVANYAGAISNENKISPEKIRELRENTAIELILNHVRSNNYGGEPLFLIYGGNHDFTRFNFPVTPLKFEKISLEIPVHEIEQNVKVIFQQVLQEEGLSEFIEP